MTHNKSKLQSIQDVIVEATAEHFALTPEHFKASKNRSDESSYQRQVCFYLVKQKTFLSNAEIGRIFGLTESSVRHGVTRVNNDLDVKDKRTITNIRLIENNINSFNKKRQLSS